MTTVTIMHPGSGSRITSRLQGTGKYVYAGDFCIAPLEEMLRKGWHLVQEPPREDPKFIALTEARKVAVEIGLLSPEEMVATQYEVDRHAEKNCGGSYQDAWRYFEKDGYDMSAVDPQYSRLDDGE